MTHAHESLGLSLCLISRAPRLRWIIRRAEILSLPFLRAKGLRSNSNEALASLLRCARPSSGLLFSLGNKGERPLTPVLCPSKKFETVNQKGFTKVLTMVNFALSERRTWF